MRYYWDILRLLLDSRCPSGLLLKDAYREALAAGVDQELLSEAAEVLEAEELRSRIKERLGTSHTEMDM